MSEEEPDSRGTSLYEPVTSFALKTWESIIDCLWKPFIAVKKWFTALEDYELFCFGCCIPVAAVFLIQVVIFSLATLEVAWGCFQKKQTWSYLQKSGYSENKNLINVFYFSGCHTCNSNSPIGYLSDCLDYSYGINLCDHWNITSFY